MAMRYNPSLSEEPRNQAAPIVIRNKIEPMLVWLERKGRLKPYEDEPSQVQIVSEDWDESLNTKSYDPEPAQTNTNEEET